MGSFQGGGCRSYQPGVDGKPLTSGCLLDPGFEVIGHAKIDARHHSLVTLGERSGSGHVRRRPAVQRRVASAFGQVVSRSVEKWWCYHELKVTSTQPQFDRARCEFARDLFCGRSQHILQSESNGRVQRCDKTFGKRTSIITAGLGSDRKLPIEVLDVWAKIHGAIVAQ